MPRNKFYAVLTLSVLAATICIPAQADDTVLATVKDGIVIQTSISDDLLTPSIETNAAEEQSEQAKPGFFERIFGSSNKSENNVNETVTDPLEETTEPSPSPDGGTASPTPDPAEPSASPETGEPTPEPETSPSPSPSELPQPSNMSIETTKNVKASGTLMETTAEAGLKFVITKEPENGTLELLDEKVGTFEYTPATDFVGDDSFQFHVVLGGQTSSDATVSITVLEEPVTPPSPEPAVYDDMIGHYAQKAAEYLYDENFVRGETVGNDTFFYPDYTMTRIQMVTFANASFFPASGSAQTTELPFADITADSPEYLKKAAATSYENELVKGSNDDGVLYFKPYDELTRVEVFTMMYNVVKPADAPDVVLDFTDADQIPEYAVPYMKAMLNSGLIKGFDDGSFRPFAKISRAQAAQLIYNVQHFQTGVKLMILK